MHNLRKRSPGKGRRKAPGLREPKLDQAATAAIFSRTGSSTVQNVTTGVVVRNGSRIREVDDFCRKLQAKGFYITQMPRMMPWGWRHAYLNDPDGHEISIYWAGENRMKKTVMRTAEEVEQAPLAKQR